MKTNSLPDFIQIYTERVDTTTRVGDSLKKSVNTDTLIQKNPMFKDSLSVGSTLLKSDSIVSDSSLFVKDSLAIADSSRQAFIQHAPKYGGKEISRYQNIGLGNDWLVGIILFSLFLLASAKFLFGKYLSKLVESVFNSHTANNLFLEKNINMVKGSMIVNLLFVVNISLFAVNVLKYVASGTGLDSGFKEFALIFLAVFLLYVGKSIVIRSLGYIFKGKNECKEYLFTVFLYNKNLGLFLFPVIIALPFVQSNAVQWLVNIGFFMIFFFFVLRIARGLKILLRKHVSIFYMILYLCALEILPLLMIYKLLVG
ncbi:DUF4271 domain-containing protein [Ancylomarina salipaludis]|uniref:DUF4271 domain-containing protein n=1 Tax=Ancylomarina salipaludis TaxID=2501299 RepID=A0A4Q1JLQ3_9BACT|nr:DUF4271 domain-containing protein [Ancylomarina salipaludis]RXQ95037.1 DUF4271 domain-containing protein [Ancylomarina salipaludis]